MGKIAEYNVRVIDEYLNKRKATPKIYYVRVSYCFSAQMVHLQIAELRFSLVSAGIANEEIEIPCETLEESADVGGVAVAIDPFPRKRGP